MDWILPNVAIGSARDAGDRDLLAREGVHSVLGLVPTLAQVDPEDWGLQDIEVVELLDGRGNRPERYLQAVDTLESLVDHSPPVLVHCHAGRSRSVVVVAGYLVRTRGLSPAAALAFISARREIQVTAGLESLVGLARSGAP